MTRTSPSVAAARSSRHRDVGSDWQDEQAQIVIRALLTYRRGPVQWVVFNRPQARNAMTWNMYDSLVEVCRQVNEDQSVRTMVLTGATGRGPAFVAGTDIAQFRSFQTAKDALDYEERGANVTQTLEEVRVPTIAAIAGPCTDGGAMLVCRVINSLTFQEMSASMATWCGLLSWCGSEMRIERCW